MGEWDDIGRAAISQTGPKFNAHRNYLVEVAAVKDQTSHHGNFFIVETVVHESDDPDLPPDTRPSWSANKKYPQTKGRILCFAGALFGIDPKNEQLLRSSIRGEHITALISEQQLGKGRFVRITTGEKETNAGRDFVLHDFAPYTGPALASRLNNPTVAAGNSAAQAQAAAAPPPVTMPGAFVPPAGFAPPMGLPAPTPFMAPAPMSLPMPGGFPSSSPSPSPSNGLPMPAGLLGLSTVPPVGGPPSIGGIPSLPPGGFPQVGGPPSIPQIPVAKQWPPAGWAAHPSSPGYFYQLGTQNYALEADLRAKQAAGQV